MVTDEIALMTESVSSSLTAVKDEDTDSVINAISSVTNTGKVGDGKIFVYDLEKAVRIRTGETGEEAL